jgi:hypothetical protein
MKKLTCGLSLLILLAYQGKTQEFYRIKQEIEEFKNLIKRNRIASCSTYEFKVTNGQVSSDSLLSTVYEYDCVGNNTHIVWFASDSGNKTYEVISEYDQFGNPLKRDVVSQGKKFTYVNNYDKKNNLIMVKSFENGRILGTSIYENDIHGNPLKESWISPDSLVKWKTLYSYDSKDRLIRQVEFDGDREAEIGLLKWNSKGQKVEFNQLDPKTNKVVSKINWEYNFRGWMTREVVYNDHSIEFSYYKNGLEATNSWKEKDNQVTSIFNSYYTRRD